MALELLNFDLIDIYSIIIINIASEALQNFLNGKCVSYCIHYTYQSNRKLIVVTPIPISEKIKYFPTKTQNKILAATTVPNTQPSIIKPQKTSSLCIFHLSPRPKIRGTSSNAYFRPANLNIVIIYQI